MLVPPHDTDAEKAVLGAVFLNNSALDDIVAVLGPSPDNFYNPSLGALYVAMLGLRGSGSPIDAVTLPNAVQGNTSEIIGLMSELMHFVPTSANAEYYAHQVLDAANMRELIGVSHTVAAQAETTDDAQGTLDFAQSAVFKIASTRRSASMCSITDALPDIQAEFDAIIESEDGMTGVASGIPALDETTTGWKDGELIIVAARPSVGKTAFLLSCMHHAASHGIPVLFFSLEMDTSKLGQRLVCLAGEVDVSTLRERFNTTNTEKQIKHTIGAMHNVPIWIDDSPALTLWQIRSEAMRFVARHRKEGGNCLVMLDYLQLMRSEDRVNGMSRTEEVGSLSRGLKLLARELSAPVIVAAQLSRAAGNDYDGFSMLDKLRESGSIEQDLDTCLILHKPHQTVHEELRNRNINPETTVFATVAKQRNGKTGETALTFDRPTQRMYGALDDNVQPSPWKGESPRDAARVERDGFDVGTYDDGGDDDAF